jgi:hypothetical protein
MPEFPGDRGNRAGGFGRERSRRARLFSGEKARGTGSGPGEAAIAVLIPTRRRRTKGIPPRTIADERSPPERIQISIGFVGEDPGRLPHAGRGALFLRRLSTIRKPARKSPGSKGPGRGSDVERRQKPKRMRRPEERKEGRRLLTLWRR